MESKGSRDKALVFEAAYKNTCRDSRLKVLIARQGILKQRVMTELLERVEPYDGQGGPDTILRHAWSMWVWANTHALL